jgi:hypothetical protein
MRSSLLLTQLALFASTTLAFYPYAPDWLEEEWEVEKSHAERRAKGLTLEIKQRSGEASTSSPEAVARQAVRLAAKYGRHLQLDEAVSGSVEKRGNSYSIMKAADTEGKLTAGLDQDGTDYSYFVRVQLGSKKKEYYMLVDTGASSSWITGSKCQTDACALHNSFGPEHSDTFKDSDEPFSIRYGTGYVNGTLGTDTVRLAGLSFEYKLGIAGWTWDDFVKFPFDGILGFSGSKGANQNLLDALDGSLDKNIFSVALHRAADGPNVGELTLGSINSDRHSGEISYTSIGNDDDWAIPLDDMTFDGKKAGVGGILGYIDTGTSFMFGPQDAVSKLHRLIPGAEVAEDGSTWRVPCDTEKPLALTFSGVSYEVSPKDWISPQNNNGKCTSNIYGFEVVKGAWLLGDAFIKNVYTVFDRDEKRIGFAPLVVPSANPSTPSSTKPPKTEPTDSSKPGSTISKPSSASPTDDASSGSVPGLVGGHQTAAPEPSDVPDGLGTPPDEEGAESSKDSAAPGLVTCVAVYPTILCIATVFALLT